MSQIGQRQTRSSSGGEGAKTARPSPGQCRDAAPPGAEARTCETDFFRDKERLSLGLRRILSPSSPTRGGQTADTFKPYGVGLVQLEDEVRVEARLTEADPSRLRFGMELRLVFVPFYTDDDGNEIVTWAFEPV